MAKIAICAGHGGSNSTPGKRTPDGEYEWNFNDKVVRAAIAVLKASGHQVLRTDDASGKTDIGLTTRVNAANNWGADVYVSVHHNALSTKWFNGSGGVETYTYTGAQPKSERLAKEVHKRIVSAMGLRDRGLKKANFYIVKNTKMPAILTEGGFMDSKVDIVAMRDDNKLKAQGEAIAAGIIAYLGGKVKLPDEPKDATPKPEPKPKPKGDSYVRSIQQWVVDYGYKIAVDGLKGPETKRGLVRVYQNELNKQFGAGLSVDGIPGPKTYAAARNVRKGAKGNLTRVLQALLYMAGQNPGPFDGDFGDGTEKAVRAFQRAKGLGVDGIAGKATWKALL
ncbi:N-acetylmuramoyl-L-alanine amidase [Bacillus sp. FSL K6-6483]